MLTPEYFKTCKNVFILFHYGWGGNHLGNLLSLRETFAPRFTQQTKTTYYAEMLRRYLNGNRSSSYGFTAHVDEYVNLELLDNPLRKQELVEQQKINVLTGHWHGYDNAFRKNKFEGLTNHCWIVMSIPKTKTELLRRLPSKFVTTPGDIEKYGHPFEFEKPKLHTDNYMVIDTDKFAHADGIAYYNSMLEIHMGITLPETANTLHKIWLENIEQATNFVK